MLGNEIWVDVRTNEVNGRLQLDVEDESDSIANGRANEIIDESTSAYT